MLETEILSVAWLCLLFNAGLQQNSASAGQSVQNQDTRGTCWSSMKKVLIGLLRFLIAELLEQKYANMCYTNKAHICDL